MVNTLQEQGFTEYISTQYRAARTESDFFYAFSISTQSQKGFPDQIISWIEGFQSQLSLSLEYFRLKTEQDILANSYIGHRAGQRVLKGQIRLGHTEDIDAFVWLCDLRGFTSLSESHSSEVILEYLNSAFEVIVSEIQAIGGEVLKYIGDSVLAFLNRMKPQSNKQAIIQAAGSVRTQQLNVEREATQTPSAKSALAFTTAQLPMETSEHPQGLTLQSSAQPSTTAARSKDSVKHSTAPFCVRRYLHNSIRTSNPFKRSSSKESLNHNGFLNQGPMPNPIFNFQTCYAQDEIGER